MSTLDRDYFEGLRKVALESLKSIEHLFLTLDGESSQFVRINGAKVRQAGIVEDAQIGISLVSGTDAAGLKRATRSATLSGNRVTDEARIKTLVSELRAEVQSLPVDPFAELPKVHASSETEKLGQLLSPFEAPDALLSPMKGVDLVGLYASGPIVRAIANSAGLVHWFKTSSYLFDYSLYTSGQKALKGLLGGKTWDGALYKKKILEDANRLKLLEQSSKKLPPGEYRAYLAPHAVYDLVSMFSWGCVSEAALQQGDSPLRKLRSGEKKFSPFFSLAENFAEGDVPRWNEEGELAPESLSLIQEGSLSNTLVSTRTAREYKVASNAATSSEGLRSPHMASGKIDEADILKELGTGVYLSNLHYLNWSDQPEGRITGMTRYACFWVENGEIKAPIENMRFDDTLFRLLGSELLGTTQNTSWIPEVSTYGMRSLGSASIPGMLVSKINFSL